MLISMVMLSITPKMPVLFTFSCKHTNLTTYVFSKPFISVYVPYLFDLSNGIFCVSSAKRNILLDSH